MKIAIIGSGGREHALVHHLSNSKKITKIYSIPGNAGTEEISLNININLENFHDLYDFINKENEELEQKCKELGIKDDLLEIEELSLKMIVALGENDVKSLEDFAYCSSDDLLGWDETVGEEKIHENGILEDFDITYSQACLLYTSPSPRD